MSAHVCPTWSVIGVSFAYANGSTAPRQYRYHTRIYADGHGAMAVNGIWHPIPATMTAVQLLTMAFAEIFAEIDGAAALGD